MYWYGIKEILHKIESSYLNLLDKTKKKNRKKAEAQKKTEKKGMKNCKFLLPILLLVTIFSNSITLRP